MGPVLAGLVLFIQPVIQAVLSPVAGIVSDRISPNMVAAFGMLVTCCGIAAMLADSFAHIIGLIIAGLIFIGFGYAFFSSPNINAIMGSVNEESLGVASSVIATMRTIGQTLSMGIVMTVFSVILGDAQISAAIEARYYSVLHISYTVMLAISCAGLFACLAKSRAQGDEG
jgi:MFS family permease